MYTIFLFLLMGLLFIHMNQNYLNNYILRFVYDYKITNMTLLDKLYFDYTILMRMING